MTGRFAVCFDEVVRTAEPPEPILEAYGKSDADRALHVAAVAFIRALQGAHDDALAVFEELSDDLRESKPPAPDWRRLTRSWPRCGATTPRPPDTSTKPLHPTGPAPASATSSRAAGAFTLSLLSLVRDHTPANAAKSDHLLQVGGKLGRDPLLRGGVSTAVHIRNGGSPHWSRVRRDPTLDRLFEGLSACWADDFPEDDPGGCFAALLQFGTTAAGSGYRWLAMECLEVYRRWWRATGRSERELAELIDFGDKTVIVIPAEVTTSVHEELGTTTLASLVTPVPEWEYVLRGIEQFAYEARKKKPRRKKAAASPQRRLAWVLEVDGNGNIWAKPKEQHTLKSGRWSGGRRWRSRGFIRRRERREFLIDQDRAAAREIVHNTDRWSSLPTYYLPVAGICELAGHPFVFTSWAIPSRSWRASRNCFWKRKRVSLRAHVDPHVSEATTESHNILLASDVHCEVTRFTLSHKKLCAAIPPGGIELRGRCQGSPVGRGLGTCRRDPRPRRHRGGSAGGAADRRGSRAVGAARAERARG